MGCRCRCFKRWERRQQAFFFFWQRCGCGRSCGCECGCCCCCSFLGCCCRKRLTLHLTFFRQPNVRTIEGVLFSAMVKAGAVSQDNADDPVKVSLSLLPPPPPSPLTLNMQANCVHCHIFFNLSTGRACTCGSHGCRSARGGKSYIY